MSYSNEKLTFDDIVEILKNNEEVKNTVSDKFSIGVAKLVEKSQTPNPSQSAPPPNNTINADS